MLVSIAMKLKYICISTLLIFFSFAAPVTPIPVSRTFYSTPTIQIVIEENSYPVMLDLGSGFSLSLDKVILDAILDKKPSIPVRWRDYKGTTYESPSYILPKIQIGDLTFENVFVKEENVEFNLNTTIGTGDKGFQIDGVIGRFLIKETNLLLDFEHSLILACNDKMALEAQGISFDEMIPIPFENHQLGILLNAETDAGPIRLILDTGATASVLRASSFENQPQEYYADGYYFLTPQKFAIENHDFDHNFFLLLDVSSELAPADGLLGMDFMENHIIYIDTPNNTLYISQSK